MRRIGTALAMVAALTVISAPTAQAGEVCGTAWFIAEKYGVAPIYGNYGEIESALGTVCTYTP